MKINLNSRYQNMLATRAEIGVLIFLFITVCCKRSVSDQGLVLLLRI